MSLSESNPTSSTTWPNCFLCRRDLLSVTSCWRNLLVGALALPATELAPSKKFERFTSPGHHLPYLVGCGHSSVEGCHGSKIAQMSVSATAGTVAAATLVGVRVSVDIDVAATLLFVAT